MPAFYSISKQVNLFICKNITNTKKNKSNIVTSKKTFF